MADFDSKLPIRALATDVTVEVANASGTTINPVEEFAQASTTSGQKGPLDQGAVTTAAPTYTTGTTNPLSLTTAGALRTDGSGATQPVSGTVTANIGTTGGLALDATLTGGTMKTKIVDAGGTNVATVSAAGAVKIDGSAVTQPVSAASLPLPTGASTEATLSALNGKFNSLGQKTMANSAPVVIASDQSAIPVTFSNTTVEVPQYNTASAVAANASNTQTYSPGSTISFDGVDASASGQMKIEIQYGTTGSEATKAVFFTSKGNLQLIWRLPNPVSITNTMSVKVIRTNMDNQAMDVYSTIQTH